MSNFYIRGVLANLVTLAILLACLFIPAGTLNYWQAWVFVAVFGVSAQALGIYFLVHDRKLVERRMNIGPVAEQRSAQKLISALFILGFVGFVVLPAFDHRFGWSPVAPVVSVIADAMIVLSFLLFFVVDEVEQLCRFYDSGRGGTARRVDGPVRVRPAPDVFGCIAPARRDAARTRFVVECKSRSNNPSLKRPIGLAAPEQNCGS